MVTSVNLGSLYTVGNRTVFGGSASGLDTEALVKSLVEAKSLPKTKLEDTISKNTEKLTALSELKDALNDFKNAVDGLRNPPGILGRASNIFDFRTATVTSDTSTLGSSFLEVSTSAGAAIGQKEIEITQLAQAKSQVFSTPFSSRTAAIVAANGDATAGTISAGVITIDTPSTAAVNVTIAENDSLNDVVAKINAVKSESGVEASVLQVSATDFRLILKSTKTGLDNEFTITDPSGVFTELTTDVAASKSALNSTLTIDGIAVERASNTITDALDNVTLNLKQLTAGAKLTVDVKADTETISAAVDNFVNAFNNIKVLAAKQTETDSNGVPTEDAKLVGNQALITAINRIDAEVTRSVLGIDDPLKLKSLQEIGIGLTDFEGDSTNPEVKNILTVSSTKFNEALSNNFDQLRKVFEFDFTSSSTNLSVFSRGNSITETDFDVEIDTVAKKAYAREVGTSTLIAELDYVEFTGGATIKGQDGTAFQGLELIYSATTSTTITVGLTQGIADRVFNTIEDFLAPDGIYETEVTSITESNNRNEVEIVDIDAELERYRESLLARFSALEQAISAVNQLLQALDSQDRARTAR